MTGEEGGGMHNITTDVRGSDCTIKGLAMSGFGPVTQIYIGGKNKRVMRNLTIDNLTVSHANYAILRRDFITRLSVPTSPTVSSATYKATPLNGTWQLTTVIF